MKLIADYHLNRLIADVTIRLRQLYSDPQCTKYYNLQLRDIGYFEMLYNMFICLKTGVRVYKKNNIPFSEGGLFIKFNRRAVSLAIVCMKKIIGCKN